MPLFGTRPRDAKPPTVERRSRPRTWFFVSGGHKCGTSWVSWMLDAHPEVVCRAAARFVGWEHSVDSWFAEEHFREWSAFHTIANTWLKGLDPDDALLAVKRAAVEAIMMLRTPDDAVAVGDKTPMFYLRDAGGLRRMFPDAKLISVIRDGRDACVSHAFHMLRKEEPHHWSSPETYSAARAHHFDGAGEPVPLFDDKVLRVAARNWLETAEGHARAAAAFGDDFLALRYEDLLEDPYRIREAFEMLGVGTSARTLAQCVEPNRFESKSGGRDPGQADPGAFVRKGVAGDWKNHFREQDKELFRSIAGDALMELGYVESMDW